MFKSVVRSDLESVLIAILKSVFLPKVNGDGSSSCQDVADVFLKAATFSKDVQGASEKSMTFEDFRCWCGLLPSVRKFLGSLLIPSDAGLSSFFVYLVHSILESFSDLLFCNLTVFEECT